MTLESRTSSYLARLERIESSKLFRAAVIFIIVVSALAIGAKTYDLPSAPTRSDFSGTAGTSLTP